MIGIFALLSGVLASAMASGAEHEHERTERVKWLSERLLGDTATVSPIPTGIDVWRWADGHRIVRMVTVAEIEAAFSSLGAAALDYELGDISEQKDDLIEAATPQEAEHGGGPEFEGPSLYVYLDEQNRPRVLILAEPTNILLGAVDKKVTEDFIRSRIWRFLKDNDREDLEEEEVLWHDNILVHPSLIGMLDKIDERFVSGAFGPRLTKTEQENFLGAFPFLLRNYGAAYSSLLSAIENVESSVKDLARLRAMMPDDLDFEEWHDSEIGGALPDTKREREEVINASATDLSFLLQEDLVPALLERMRKEIKEASSVLETHTIQGAHGSFQIEEPFRPFVVTNAAFDWRNGEGVFEGHVSVKGWTSTSDGMMSDEVPTPRWELDTGRGYSDVQDKGMIRLIGSWLETKEELYNKSDAPVWVWPGDLQGTVYEMDRLLGTRSFRPLEFDLLDFVGVSYDLGLTHPEHIRIWGYGIKDWSASHKVPRYPMQTSVVDEEG